ncbi:MAG TPA: RDD family protein [Candidatus Limnocylindrales bacterium]|nr:RDD family protein [Candidatus Limnocylindrales bacterium]
MTPAGFARRGVAALVDSLVGAAVWSLGGMWLVLGLWALHGLPRSGAELLLILSVLGVLGIAVRLVVQVVFVGGCGQTPGQMAMGIGVVDAAGQVPGYGRAARRWSGGMLSMLTLGLVSLPFMFGRDRRGLADRVAGTRVVRLAQRPAGDRLA